MLFAFAAHAAAPSDVARATYLWQTGQDDAAAEVARAAVAAHADDLAAFRLLAAIDIARGDGASLEASVRERWSESTQDPVRRTKLAIVLAQRHAEKGAWCDEVSTLVRPVLEGEPHYWATVADRLREARCVGGTGHADAELRRIAEKGGIGWADGVLAELDAGYVKEDLPAKLERVWTEEPWKLARAAALWEEGVAGAGKASARHVTNKALDDAVEGDDPVLVHAAMLAWRASDEPKKADEAAERLRALDPAADTTLVRDLDGVTDPPAYAAIEACTEAYDPADIVNCLDEVVVPETGALASLRQVQRARALEYAGRTDEAYAALKAAWQAEPSHRFNARTFAKAAFARSELLPPGELKADLELALEATRSFVGPVPADAAALPVAQRTAIAKDLDLVAGLLVGAGRAEEALEPSRQAWAVHPTSARQVRLGMALAAAGRADEAVLHLAHGLAIEVDDTALITRARDVLRPLAKAWGREVGDLVADAARAPGDDDAPRSPLVGAPFAAPDLLPAFPDPKKPGVRVIVAWASWRPDSVAALARLGPIGKLYAEKGVQVRILNVDTAEVAPPAEAPADAKWAGPAAMRQLRTVALPVAVVVDAKGKVAAVLAPWSRSGLDLEKAIDALLPAP